MKEGTCTFDHFNEFNKNICHLASINGMFVDEGKSLILLSSLSSLYEYITTTLFYGNNTIDLDEVNVALLSNELRKKDSSNDL